MPSAFRYALSAIEGIRRAPGAETNAAGGGAELVAAAICIAAGGCAMATTDGPDRSCGSVGATAANGVTSSARTGASAGPDGPDAPTAAANMRGVKTATPNAGLAVS